MFGKTFWGKEWLRALEMVDWENSLPRGGSYALRGKVLSIKIFENKIFAKVQGTAPKPYNVKIIAPKFTPMQLEILRDLLSSN